MMTTCLVSGVRSTGVQGSASRVDVDKALLASQRQIVGGNLGGLGPVRVRGGVCMMRYIDAIVKIRISPGHDANPL